MTLACWRRRSTGCGARPQAGPPKWPIQSIDWAVFGGQFELPDEVISNVPVLLGLFGI